VQLGPGSYNPTKGKYHTTFKEIATSSLQPSQIHRTLQPQAGNMALYSQRTAQLGKYINNKSVNKLSTQYMDMIIQQKRIRDEFRAISVINE
jgi:hypothetical protein